MPHVQVRPSKDLRNHYREIANPNTEWYTHDEVWDEISMSKRARLYVVKVSRKQENYRYCVLSFYDIINLQ